MLLCLLGHRRCFCICPRYSLVLNFYHLKILSLIMNFVFFELLSVTIFKLYEDSFSPL